MLVAFVGVFAQINVSTGLGAIGAPDSWKVSTTIPVVPNAFIIPTNFSVWEAAPVAVTNARWISVTAGGAGSGMTDFFYEKTFNVPTGIKELKTNFKVAVDDVLKKIELVNGSTIINIPFTPAAYYKFVTINPETVKCPKPGEWKLRITVFCGDPKGSQGPTALLVSGTIDYTQGECCDCKKPTDASATLSINTNSSGITTATATAAASVAGLGNGWTLKETNCADNNCKWVPGPIKYQSTGSVFNIPAGILQKGKCYVITHYVNVCSKTWNPSECLVYRAICFTICDNNIRLGSQPVPNGLKQKSVGQPDEEIDLMELKQVVDIHAGKG